MAFFRSGGFRFARLALVSAGLLALAGCGGAIAFYLSFLRDLPDLRGIEDYRPPLASWVLDRDGRRIGEFAYERRSLVPVEEIPRHAQLAFVAAEDKAFFEHKGIDYVSILRAAWANLRAGGEIKQGASTITQQMVKSLLLSPERTFRRKFREMILARQIEQDFSKDEILYLYVNQIYFGHGAWGIAEAARTYFAKPVSELSVSEAALLAGLPQRPSQYSPYRSPEAAEKRRRYVLGRMLADEIIDSETYETALAAPPVIRPPEEREDAKLASYFNEGVRRYLFDRFGGERVLRDGLIIETTLDLRLQRAAVEAVRQGLRDHDHRQGFRGPLRHVAEAEIESEIAKLAEENGLEAQRDPIRETNGDTESAAAGEEAVAQAGQAGDDAGNPPSAGGTSETVEALALELPIGEPLVGVVTQVDSEAQTARVAFGPGSEGVAHLEDVSWARKPDSAAYSRPVKQIANIFQVGDVLPFVRLEDIEPSASDGGEEDADASEQAPLARLDIHQEPIVQGALLSLEVATGDVLALVGGSDFKKSEFDRVTQAHRQPGSAFKPLIYGAALSRDYTPVSTLWDRPVVYEDPVSGFKWKPKNYGRQFYGPIPMRTALVRSINNATVHLFENVGVDFVIDYTRRLGIQSPLNRDLSLALGSSNVTLLELTTAYAVFPNKGRRVVPRFITRVTDREGNVLLEDVPLGNPPPALRPRRDELALGANDDAESLYADDFYPDGEILPTDQIITAAEAYLMCDLLKAVVSDPRGTGWRLRRLGRPVAGKTGTTNDQADAWFMGFSPDLATGVWVGHDEIRVLGKGETGSRAAAPIWVDFMEVALADRPIRDFDVPEHIVFQRIDRATGFLANADTADAYFQPFLEDTVPTLASGTASSASDTRRSFREDSF